MKLPIMLRFADFLGERAGLQQKCSSLVLSLCLKQSSFPELSECLGAAPAEDC